MSTNFKYQYNWARNVINTFVEKYARGTYNLARMIDIAPGEFRHLCCCVLARGNSLRWESLKRVIKLLNEDSHGDIRCLGSQDQKVLYKYLVILAENDAIDDKSALGVLDDLENRVLF